MAYVCILPGNRDLSKFANVGMAVGRGKPNNRGDVLLVQYLLRELFRNPSEHKPPLVPPEQPVRVDGRFGPNTHKGIVKFKLNIFSQGGSIALDPWVDTARISAVSSISQTTYAILWMNYLYKLARPTEFDDMLAGKGPDMPAELAAELHRFTQLFQNVNPWANVVGTIPRR